MASWHANSIGQSTLELNAPSSATVGHVLVVSSGSGSVFDLGTSTIVAALGYTPLNKAGDTLTGNLLFTTDNTLDIGASGATRPRTGYFGTSVVTPLVAAAGTGVTTLGNATGGVTVPGAATFSGNVGIGTNPIVSFDVAGHIRLNGNYFMGPDINDSYQPSTGLFQGFGHSFTFRNSQTTADLLTISSTGAATLSGSLEIASKTIATLPAASANSKKRFLVTDSTPANRQVFSNGSAWYYEDGSAV